MQPIETRYNSYRFRSRLEARWAKFFDALGMNWQYEPDSFELSSGLYLPDFALSGIGVSGGIVPDSGVWVEIKPGYTPEAHERLADLCVTSGRFGILLAVPQVWMSQQPRQKDSILITPAGEYLLGCSFMCCADVGTSHITFAENKEEERESKRDPWARSAASCAICGYDAYAQHAHIDCAIDDAHSARFGAHE